MTAIQKAREALVAARDTLSAASRQLTDDHKIVLGGKRWGEVTSAKIDAALAALDAETEVKANLTRPIIGIENRTAQEAFDIMCDRIRSALAPPESRS